MEFVMAITLIEKNNDEAPNMGTIIFHGDVDDFNTRIKDCIESHFDAEVDAITIQDGLDFIDVRNSPPLDAVVKLKDYIGDEGVEFDIEIQQTFIY